MSIGHHRNFSTNHIHTPVIGRALFNFLVRFQLFYVTDTNQIARENDLL